MNQNFDLEKEKAEQDGSEWQFGAMSPQGIVSVPLAERDQWLPVGETQFDALVDFNDCASRSPVNHLEALFTYHYNHAMKPENKQWLYEEGYYMLHPDGDRIAFSDRFIAILSGTTHTGNSLKAPLEAVRTQGLVPKKLLPKEDWMSWDDYYDPAKITQPLKDLGQEFRRRFPINYEQVPRTLFADLLKSDMIGVAGYAWPVPANGVYPKTEGTFNHAFLLYALPAFQIFDNYLDWDKTDTKQIEGDFTKTLAPDYVFYEYGYRVYISAENGNKEDIRLTVLETLAKYGLLSFFADWWQRFTKTA